MVIGRVVCTSLLALALLVRSPAVAGQQKDAVSESSAPKARLLEVPFVPQSEALCGGAAAAMVFRYWKTAPAHAEDFASLVDDSAEGIRLRDLARAIQERGWRALLFTGTGIDIRQHLNQGRPIIALIQDRPARYHYVVVVAWARSQIVFHDPARGPFRVIDVDAFDRVWAATNRTALLILPQDDLAEDASANTRARDSGDDCANTVEHAVQIARSGDLDDAETLLSLAEGACPSSSAALRELAGIRFLQRRWNDAAALAERAVVRDPADMHAWQLLASARFVGGDADGALRAWNSRNEPRVDLAHVEGLDRTHYEVVSDLLNLPAQTVLTASQLERAKRRIGELPSLQMSRVTYVPRASGLATVEVAVVERPLIPRTWPSAAAAVLEAATTRESRLDVASPTGNGELWAASWRWWAGRPRVSLAVATPQLGGRTGLWRLDGEWQRETYTRDTLITTERRRAGLTLADWRSGNFRWEIHGALDHWLAASTSAEARAGSRGRGSWKDAGKYLSAGAAAERRFLRDHLAVRAQGVFWQRIGLTDGFGLAGLSSAWRSAREGTSTWMALGGATAVSARAPLDVWPAADTGHVRQALLRAHPLLVDGAIRAASLGRVLTHTTIEFQRDLPSHPLIRIRWAGFVDAAKQALTMRPGAVSGHIDFGVGLRAQLPATPGMLRVDIARGLRDGNIAVSAAWQPSWPAWEQ
jgi:predicted double-glycine peptidase